MRTLATIVTLLALSGCAVGSAESAPRSRSESTSTGAPAGAATQERTVWRDPLSSTTRWTALHPRRTRLTVVRSRATGNRSARLRSTVTRRAVVRTRSRRIRLPAGTSVVRAGIDLRSRRRATKVTVELVELRRNRVVGRGRRVARLPGSRWRRVRAARAVKRGDHVRVRLSALVGGRHRAVRFDDVRLVAVVKATRRTTVGPSAPGWCEVADYRDPRYGRLDWADEFSGTTIDTSRWRVRDNLSLSYDVARVLARNAKVESGHLRLRADRETVAGRPFTSAYVDTIGKYSRRYGTWIMRARVPTPPGISRGVWPAFWLRSDTSLGEIDIMEASGEPTIRDDYRAGSYYWTLHADTTKQQHPGKTGGWGTSVGDPPIADDWHTYGVTWDAGCVTWLFDGKVVGRVRRADVAWFERAIAGRFNIRLNIQVGQAWNGFPDPARPELTVMPADYLVDYVRVYAPR